MSVFYVPSEESLKQAGIPIGQVLTEVTLASLSRMWTKRSFHADGKVSTNLQFFQIIF